MTPILTGVSKMQWLGELFDQRVRVVLPHRRRHRSGESQRHPDRRGRRHHRPDGVHRARDQHRPALLLGPDRGEYALRQGRRPFVERRVRNVHPRQLANERLELIEGLQRPFYRDEAVVCPDDVERFDMLDFQLIQ